MKPDQSPVTDGRPAPLTGCRCEVCSFLRRQARLDADLEANYRLYEAGLLVSRDETE